MRTSSMVFMKTKKVQLAAGIIAAMAFSNYAHAQTNTSYGANSLNIGGVDNVAFGLESMYTGGAPTTGTQNAAVGRAAMNRNTSGSDNAAMGAWSLFYNTTGSGNAATGSDALQNNTTGNNNVANGFSALFTNISGSYNVATGYRALYSDSTGGYNTATGAYALTSNATASYNSGFGYQALQAAKMNNNTAMGFRSSYLTTTGTDNTSSGFVALYNNSTGSNNTAIGSAADVSTGTLSNATSLGSGAVVNANNKVRIGNANVTVIEGQVSFTAVSDGRFKTNIKEEDVKGLEFIKKLRPVVYNLEAKKLTEFWTKNMPDSIRRKYLSQDFTAATNMRQSGFIAQEVEKAAKEVNYNFNGVHVPESDNDNYGLAYSDFVVPLVKGMQEQQKMIEDQKQMIEKLQKQVNDLLKGKGSTTGIDQIPVTGASMEQNAPNPFSHETVIKFNLPAQIGNAYMTVYDLSGKQIKTLPISQRGSSSITITSDQLEAGIYIYSIIADGNLVDSKRMVVMDK
jgi:hypothetical protein